MPVMTEETRRKLSEFVKMWEERKKRRAHRRLELRRSRAKSEAPPPGTPHRSFRPETTVHIILEHLDKHPSTRQELITDARLPEVTANGQILRLLDYGLVDQDRNGVYTLTKEGEGAMRRLDAGMSYTRWLR